MERRTISTSFTTREENEQKHICGYFSVFNEPYEIIPGFTERIAPTAFDDALDDDIRCLWNHNSDIVLGRTAAGTASFKADKHGLHGDVIINEDDRTALDCYARNKRGDVSQASFGFDILKDSWEWLDDGSCIRTIEKVKLYEVSPCTFPAYEGTDIKARAADAKRAAQDFLDKKKERIKERMNKWH